MFTDCSKILHILTASLEQAQIVLSAALQAGFRESGAINLVSTSSEPAMPIVAVRSMGLSLESIIGCGNDRFHRPTCNVSEESLRSLIEIANERFEENTKRIERFRCLLKKLSAERPDEVKRKGQEGEEWEHPQVRRERKRAEGLLRSQQMKASSDYKCARPAEDVEDTSGLELIEQNR
jgi:tRNA wybutosine-synthesizing protein 3